MEYLLKKHRKIPHRGQYEGCYIDVGCCYPVRASNTLFFYERGWRGLCIDANPEAKAEFVRVRPKDIYVTSAVGLEPGNMQFSIYSSPQLNSFDPSRKIKLADKFIKDIEVPVARLDTLITENLGNCKIDLLTIDTEGWELQVLKSASLEKHRPSLVCLEIIEEVQNIASHELCKFMRDIGYKLVSHTGHDAMFIDKS